MGLHYSQDPLDHPHRGGDHADYVRSVWAGGQGPSPCVCREDQLAGTASGDSAPHGAGRQFGRNEAKRSLSMSDFKDSMSNIYSTSVCEQTLDEAPAAYKDSATIIKDISQIVNIKDRLIPVINIKDKS